jgi:N-succinyldiaminopimelate aminotransferase
MPARRVASVTTTIFTEVTRRAQERGAVNLAQGFPDFDGPEFAKHAAIDAIRAGHGQYARMAGWPALVEAVAAHDRRWYGVDVDPESEVTVTSGATEALMDALLALVDPGDEVIVFEPLYDSYRAGIEFAGGRPVAVPLEPPRWGFDPARLRAAVTPRTRVILLNSPHNPSGHVVTEAELDAIEEVVHRTGAVLVTDEVYEHLVYEGAHRTPLARASLRDRTVRISSFGKTMSLTGWKVGWAVASPALTRAVRAVHQFSTFATATPLQVAAAVALGAPDAFYEELRATYVQRRDRLRDGLQSLGFEVDPVSAGTFLLASFHRFGWADDRAAVERLLDAGVATIPPSAFLLDGRPFDRVRFAFCKRLDTLDAALQRLRDADLQRLCP